MSTANRKFIIPILGLLLSGCTDASDDTPPDLTSSETPTVVNETPTATPGTTDTETETPTANTETPIETPGTETDTPDTETDTPDTETETPDTETDTPDTETDTPDTETDTPDTETETPDTETETPDTETDTPDTETETPATETHTSTPSTPTPPLNCNDGVMCWYADLDNDGWGDNSQPTTIEQMGYVSNAGDCDDNDDQIHPHAIENCDGVDKNCDGIGLEDGEASYIDAQGISHSLDALMDGAIGNPAAFEFTEPGIVTLCPGTYYAHLTLSENVAIIGARGSAETTIDAGKSGRAITITADTHPIDAAYLEGLTLSDGNADTGGCLSINNAELSAHDLLLTSCNASTYGGAIHSLDSTLNLHDTSISTSYALNNGGAALLTTSVVNWQGGIISDNDSGNDGGALWVANNTALDLIDIEINGNKAADDGGGIAIYDSELTTTNTTLFQNEAINTDNGTIGGGGIYANDASITLTNTSFLSNHAKSGAGLYLKGTDLIYEGGEVSGNDAIDASGGGLRLEAGSGGILNNLTIEDNEADSYGAGLYLYAGPGVSVSNSTFINNRTQYGAGLYSTGANLSLENVNLQSNTAFGSSGRGGGFYVDSGVISLTDSTISSNIAEEDDYPAGGGLYCIGAATVNLINTTVNLNISAHSGGGALLNSCQLTATNSDFEENTAQSDGGGIYAISTPLTFNGGSFRNNLAKDDGGALYSTAATSVSIDNLTVSGNTAYSSAGGILLANGGAVEITQSTFTQNDAKGTGGALFLQTVHTIMEETTFTDNESLATDPDYNRGGGAIYARDGSLTASQLTFTENGAKNYGGAILCSDSDLSISNTLFMSNQGDVDGGAIAGRNGCQFEGSELTFEDNQANADGGALYLTQSSSAELDQCIFEDNVAQNGGGAVYVGSASATFTDCQFTANRAPYGGALSFVGLSAANLVESEICTYANNIDQDVYSHDIESAYSYGEEASFYCTNNGCQDVAAP